MADMTYEDFSKILTGSLTDMRLQLQLDQANAGMSDMGISRCERRSWMRARKALRREEQERKNG